VLSPVLNTFRANEHVRELRGAAERYRRARGLPRPGSPAVLLRAPLELFRRWRFRERPAGPRSSAPRPRSAGCIR
jgi:hypothetical protein